MVNKIYYRRCFVMKNLLMIMIVVLFAMFVGVRGPAAESFDLPLQGGGFGIFFEHDSITVTSQNEVNLDISAADEYFVDLTVSSAATNASLTVQGLRPSTVYYVYLDDFSNLTKYTTTEDGSLSLTFTLVEALPELPNLRHVIIQDEPSTLFLRDDATGGDCASIGSWDAATKTCALLQTVTEAIQIDDDAVTLDCNNQIIQKGNGTYAVINRYGTNDFTVKNCIIKGTWSFGILAQGAERANIINNVVDGARVGISFFLCENCQFIGNTIKNGTEVGFLFQAPIKNSASVRQGIVTDNTITNTRFGWKWAAFWFLGCVDEFLNNTVDGKEVLYLCQADGATVTNTDTYATIGVFSSDNVTISNVTFPGGVGQSVFLQDVTNSLIEGIDTGVLETDVGIEVFDSGYAHFGRSDNVTIRNNNLHNVRSGIKTRPPGDNRIHNFLIENNSIIASIQGITLSGDQCTVVGNDIGGTLTGRGFYSFSSNTVTGNTIYNNKVGLRISEVGSVFRDNTISGNLSNVDFGVYPNMPLSRLDVDFDASNLVEGKTVLLLKNPVEQTITGDWAMILVHSGDGVTIQDVTTANNNADSIALVQTNNSIIVGNTVGSANVGIHIVGGQNNQIVDNTFVEPIPPYRTKYPAGIFIDSSSGNVVAGNSIDGYMYGIRVETRYADAVNNLVDGNVITEGNYGGYGPLGNGGYGVYVYGSYDTWLNSNNTISHNDITATYGGLYLRWVTNSLITGNIIHDTPIFGLSLYGATNNTMMNNLFYGQRTTTYMGDIWYRDSTATDNRVFGNDFFSGISTLAEYDPILCDPDTSVGIGNFFDRSIPAERTRYGPCGIAGTPFTESGLAMSWQAVEQCRDGRDNDGDADVDLADTDCYGNLYTEIEAPPCTDADNDGYAYNGGQCGPMDCNDTDAEVNPSALEVCLDNQDNNCDGQIDECTAEDNVQTLIEVIQSDELTGGTEGSLVSKLGNAIKSLDRENQSTILNQLGAFENEVEAQRGKHLTEEQADYLLQVVADIREDIEAGVTP